MKRNEETFGEVFWTFAKAKPIHVTLIALCLIGSVVSFILCVVGDARWILATMGLLVLAFVVLVYPLVSRTWKE